MSAHIVAVSQPVGIPGIESADDFIAYAARVSNPSNQGNTETAPKLISYLLNKQHWSPFEMVSVTMEIETTRDIARQMLRHRSFSFQEFSQRYADPTKDLGFVTREARMQDPKNRQNSIGIVHEDGDSALQLLDDWDSMQQHIVDAAKQAYDWAISKGIAKEQARVVLPEGLTKSKLYMSGTMRSWIHYCNMRGVSKMGAQKEHTEVARDCWSSIESWFPNVSEGAKIAGMCDFG